MSTLWDSQENCKFYNIVLELTVQKGKPENQLNHFYRHNTIKSKRRNKKAGVYLNGLSFEGENSGIR